jgi:lipoprotein-releasing system permease protein
LNTAFEIAKRISFFKQKNYTRFIVRLSIAATAISVATILLTFSIVNGFQSVISKKVFSFWGHIQIASVDGNYLNENPAILNQLKSNPEIVSATPYLNQTMVLAKEIEIEGLNAKGIADFSMIPDLSKGRTIKSDAQSISREVVISKAIASKLKIDTGDQVKLYFLQNGAVQERKLIVVGLFHTGIEEYDLKNVFVDLKLLQQLVQSPDMINGYQVNLKDLDKVDEVQNGIKKTLPENWVSSASADVYPQLFDWIKVQSINRNITIFIMLLIAIVNLVTCLLILILERVPMIGGLTAMGASHQMIRKVFMYQASFITWMGIALGVLIGIGVSVLQQKIQWIQLDESAYLVDILPILVKPIQVIGVVLGTALVSYLSFLLPTLWIKRLSPAKAVRFD